MQQRYLYLIAIMSLGVVALSAMNPSISVGDLMKEGMVDFQRDGSFDELIALVQKEKKYLVEVDKDRGTLLDFAVDVYVHCESVLNENDDQTQKRLETSKELITKLLKIGRKDRSFETILTKKIKWLVKENSSDATKEKFTSVIEVVKNALPKKSRFFNTKKADKNVSGITIDGECSFCLDRLADGLVVHLDCDKKVTHSFHASCLEKIINAHRTCPLCSSPIKLYNPCIQQNDYKNIEGVDRDLTNDEQEQFKRIFTNGNVSVSKRSFPTVTVPEESSEKAFDCSDVSPYAVLVDAFAYQEAINLLALNDPNLNIFVPKECTFEDPSTGQPFICSLAESWKNDFLNDKKREALEEVVKKSKNDPLFLWQLKDLMRLIEKDEGAYDKVLRILDHSQLPRIDAFTTLYEMYKNDTFPYEQPDVDIKLENQKKSALYTAQLFTMVQKNRLNEASDLIKSYPALANVSDEYGKPLIFEVIKRYAWCVNLGSAYDQEKKELEGFFGLLLFAGADPAKKSDRLVKSYVRRGASLVQEVVPVCTKNGVYPSVQELVNEDGVSTVDLKNNPYESSSSITPDVKTALRKVLSLKRKKFIEEYHWMESYLPEPTSKKSTKADRSKESRKKVQEEIKDPTFLDSWKGTLKYFAVGAVAGLVSYYVGTRYMSTPQELYGKKETTVA